MERVVSQETRQINDEALESKALSILEDIERSTHYPFIPKDLDVIAVLGNKSGFFNTASETPQWMSFMDTDRVNKASNLWKEVKDNNKNSNPLLVYTGNFAECAYFMQGLQIGEIEVPPESVQIINLVKKNDRVTTHLHTKDNLEALIQCRENEDSKLFGAKKIVIVSHLNHFIRIPFYLKKLQDNYPEANDISFYPYAVDERTEATDEFKTSELQKLKCYAMSGELSQTPAKLSYFFEENYVDNKLSGMSKFA